MFKICANYDDPVNDIEVFYMSKGITDLLRQFPEEAIDETVQLFHRLVANNSNTSKLYGHLEKIGFNEEVPIKSWICRGYSGILHETALEKIWDKVIAGSLKILAYVGFALIESTKLALQNCQTTQEAILFVKQTSEEIDEKIAQDAIDLWIDDGSQILPGDKQTLKKLGERQQIDSSVNLIEPNFKMATMIKIGPLDNFEVPRFDYFSK